MSHRRRPTCPETGKVRYDEHHDVTLVLRDLRRAASSILDGHATRRRETRSYRCLFCAGWHLTSQPLQGIVARAAPVLLRS